MTERNHTLSRYVLLLISAALCLLLCSCNPILSLNPKYAYSSFELELGEPISDDIAEYVDFSKLSEEDAKFVREHTTILYDGKNIKESDLAAPGGHTLTINYCGHQYREYIIEIFDHEPPVFTKNESLYTFATLPIDEAEYNSMFAAEDNSGDVSVELDIPDIDYNTAGEYKISAVATDSSGNKATSEATVFVQEPSYGAVGTYVYVSIPDQHLTYFVDSKAVLDCPVVTGNTNLGHSTPRGTYTLNYKARNLVLKGRENDGTEYQSFVSYWMAFIGSSYGMHDATWRTNFGGNIYQSGGSHGCVNMPYESAARLYEIIEPGTPVLIY
jgi:lipoprotein-anchoring transpeptidase ErfK/SrfK